MTLGSDIDLLLVTAPRYCAELLPGQEQDCGFQRIRSTDRKAGSGAPADRSTMQPGSAARKLYEPARPFQCATDPEMAGRENGRGHMRFGG